MNKILASSLALIMLCSGLATAKVIPYISIRSQSENAARELVLWQTQINLFDKDCSYYGSFSLTPEYTKTFKDNRLARCLFADALTADSCCNTTGSCCNNSGYNNSNCCSSFKVQGSAVTDRSSNALLADYFGLPIDYDSTVRVTPEITNGLVDINFYLGLDRWATGLYFRIHAPVVHSKWNLGFCETINDAGKANLPYGYFSGANAGTYAAPYNATRDNLVTSFEDFVVNEATPTISGVTFNPLTNAKFYKCSRSTTKLSEIQMAFGWNFALCDDYHFGLNLRGAAPTGSRPNGKHIFEPIVGNGRHGELGLGFTGHWTFWRSEDECDDCAFYLDANVTHMFKTRQCRTFDYCGKPLSRYMLAQKMKAPAENIQKTADADVKPTYQFDGEYTTLANLSTIQVDVSAAVQADVVLKFAYNHRNFQFDLGYEFWARTCEKICPRCDCNTPAYWALKGDAFTYGFITTTTTAIPLSATETDATVFCGTNGYSRTDNIAWTLNPGVDNAALADNADSDSIENWNGSTYAPMYSSFPPNVFSTSETSQWDIKGGESKGTSNKVFANFGYLWKDHECWVPYLGIGAEVEFGSHCSDDSCCSTTTACTQKTPATTALRSCCSTSNCCSSSSSSCCNNSCDNNDCCMNCALSQWGVWVKGGVSFN